MCSSTVGITGRCVVCGTATFGGPCPVAPDGHEDPPGWPQYVRNLARLIADRRQQLAALEAEYAAAVFGGPAGGSHAEG